MIIHDISADLNSKTLVYPGDPKVRIAYFQKLERNDWNISRVSMNLHAGSHLDGPLHAVYRGNEIKDISLEKTFGNAIVIENMNIPFGQGITTEHLLNCEIRPQDIVLFKTLNSTITEPEYKKDHISLMETGAKTLIEMKIKAVGIDYLNIGSLRVHQILLSKGILIYENLKLAEIPPKRYQFYGFPLKIKAEASPVRAVLIEE